MFFGVVGVVLVPVIVLGPGIYLARVYIHIISVQIAYV